MISSSTLFFTPNPKYRVTKSLHLEDGDFSALRRRDCGHDLSLWICVFSWLEGMVNVLVNQFYHVETVLKRLHIKDLSNTAQGLTQFLNRFFVQCLLQNEPVYWENTPDRKNVKSNIKYPCYKKLVSWGQVSEEFQFHCFSFILEDSHVKQLLL